MLVQLLVSMVMLLVQQGRLSWGAVVVGGES